MYGLEVYEAYTHWVASSDRIFLDRAWSLLPDFVNHAMRNMHITGYRPGYDLEQDTKSYALKYLMNDIEKKRYELRGPRSFGALLVRDCLFTMKRFLLKSKREKAKLIYPNPEWVTRKTPGTEILGNVYLQEVPEFVLKFAGSKIRFAKGTSKYRLCLDLIIRLVNSKPVPLLSLVSRYRLPSSMAEFFYSYCRFLCKQALYHLRDNEDYDVLNDFDMRSLSEQVDNERAGTIRPES